MVPLSPKFTTAVIHPLLLFPSEVASGALQEYETTLLPRNRHLLTNRGRAYKVRLRPEAARTDLPVYPARHAASPIRLHDP